ncbi:YqcC family protein [Halopseudomonas pelagia]|uniref:Pseudouridine synthase n=1 Tax=Halopseudomonas pelagia TaxID=553151 RepID=A0AA91Z4P1_9GAMM|nr:YqcC family protein [Halopseudomonas pelagia]PCC98043.1 pseudouridine synthase [Halopseudomonas pelagia]QFY55766.1 hypothetical protein EAO82_04940 [Halopseudomonas pelagia]
MAQALSELERELRALQMWSVEPPDARRLASGEPFCVDTLGFEEWLQWVFVQRMGDLVAQRGLLPGAAQLTPMGEQAFVHLGRRQQPLLLLLARIDQLSRQLT